MCIRDRIEFDQVVLNTEPAAGEKLMLLQGWLPASEEDPIVAYLNSQSVYYLSLIHIWYIFSSTLCYIAYNRMNYSCFTNYSSLSPCGGL